jgi:hypothetical protein
MYNEFNWKEYCNQYYKERENDIKKKTENLKKDKSNYHKLYRKTHKDIISKILKKYLRSSKGKIYRGKFLDYRKRHLGSNLLNDWFEGCNRHHINSNDIICIPKELHQSYGHNHKKLDTMVSINRIAFQYLTDTIKQL